MTINVQMYLTMGLKNTNSDHKETMNCVKDAQNEPYRKESKKHRFTLKTQVKWIGCINKSISVYRSIRMQSLQIKSDYLKSHGAFFRLLNWWYPQKPSVPFRS